MDNTINWKVGDLVIHDADEKSERMLMRVTNVIGNGRIETEYANRGGSQPAYINPKEVLLDPDRFGIRTTTPPPSPEEAIIEWTGGYSGVHRVVVRPEVAEFAIEMEMVLRENDHKTGWKAMEHDTLFRRIKDEFEELQDAQSRVSSHLCDRADPVYIQMMRGEAIDIANFCMFLCHNYPKADEVPNAYMPYRGIEDLAGDL